jgi:hypothetical protein
MAASLIVVCGAAPFENSFRGDLADGVQETRERAGRNGFNINDELFQAHAMEGSRIFERLWRIRAHFNLSRRNQDTSHPVDAPHELRKALRIRWKPVEERPLANVVVRFAIQLGKGTIDGLSRYYFGRGPGIAVLPRLAPLFPDDLGKIADGDRFADEWKTCQLIRNAQAEFLFHGQDQFHEFEAVDVEIFEKSRIVMNQRPAYAGSFGDQIEHSELDLPEGWGERGLSCTSILSLWHAIIIGYLPKTLQSGRGGVFTAAKRGSQTRFKGDQGI